MKDLTITLDYSAAWNVYDALLATEIDFERDVREAKEGPVCRKIAEENLRRWQEIRSEVFKQLKAQSERMESNGR